MGDERSSFLLRVFNMFSPKGLRLEMAMPAAATAATPEEARVKALLRTSHSVSAALSRLLPGRVFFNGVEYQSSVGSYWSVQEQEVKPQCVLLPRSSQDVQLAILALSVAAQLSMPGCKFAIRSGGHTAWAGSANIHDGVTIDLRYLNQVTVSEDRTLVSVGPGNRWGDVYSTLEEYGLATSGGRVASVGVGGLITGGGLSFFSSRYGFVCDNVVNYEIVLASGKLINVNALSYPDLFKALKGGSNNFGVVTRFDIKAFEQGPIWGGFLGTRVEDREKVFAAFEKIARTDVYDPFASFIISYTWRPNMGWISASTLAYTKAEEHPPVYAELESLPITFSTTRIASLSTFTKELDATTPAGHRETFVTLTFKNSAVIFSKFFNLCDDVVASFPEDDGFMFSVSYQPLPQTITSQGAGKNSLGLSAADGDLINVLVGIKWENAENDAAIETIVKELFTKGTLAAQALGLYHEYKYLNYSAAWQDPISGYGAETKQTLRSVSKKYDPKGLFQKQVPGGFKLF